jgi:hypothetical protein
MSRKYRIGHQQRAAYDAALNNSIHQQLEIDRLQGQVHQLEQELQTLRNQQLGIVENRAGAQ